MKTVGNLIKEGRLKKNYSKEDLGALTHIKTNFIAAIEQAEWQNLPEFNIVIGFVKSIAHFLNISENQAVSLLRRDYPPNLINTGTLPIRNSVRGVERKFVWGPRMTFLAGVAVIIILVLGYLGFQYRKFNLSPTLTLDSPKQGQVITSPTLAISGETDPDATITINDQPVIVNANGSFSTQIDVSDNTTSVKVVAKSRSGKTTTVSRTIKVTL